MGDDTKPRNARLFSDQVARALAPKSSAQGMQLGSFARGRYGERACSVTEAHASKDLLCAQRDTARRFFSFQNACTPVDVKETLG
ncbi:hypothetical protein M0D45_06065 [Xanthomonas prunicola]|uniref:hypothetical protein n=1 Tax=Xanthomonas prunicola TaxID=2053930 RepID=UPI0021B32F8B|nr:hypothetical protein [Xanthomonas prunicola]UXA54300.1 hypothetical protein M0D45_06065 [Xanthomonas prunicola]